jgi:hypothetical protein
MTPWAMDSIQSSAPENHDIPSILHGYMKHNSLEL